MATPRIVTPKDNRGDPEPYPLERDRRPVERDRRGIVSRSRPRPRVLRPAMGMPQAHVTPSSFSGARVRRDAKPDSEAGGDSTPSPPSPLEQSPAVTLRSG